MPLVERLSLQFDCKRRAPPDMLTTFPTVTYLDIEPAESYSISNNIIKLLRLLPNLVSLSFDSFDTPVMLHGPWTYSSRGSGSELVTLARLESFNKCGVAFGGFRDDNVTRLISAASFKNVNEIWTDSTRFLQTKELGAALANNLTKIELVSSELHNIEPNSIQLADLKPLTNLREVQGIDAFIHFTDVFSALVDLPDSLREIDAVGYPGDLLDEHPIELMRHFFEQPNINKLRQKALRKISVHDVNLDMQYVSSQDEWDQMKEEWARLVTLLRLSCGIELCFEDWDRMRDYKNARLQQGSL